MTQWKGLRSAPPLLGDHRAAGGLLENVGGMEALRSPYKIYIEDWTVVCADGELAARGAVVTDISSPTSPTEVITGAEGYLLLNPGTSVDDGIEVQFTTAPSGATTASPATKLPNVISTATLMDNREIWFQTRVGFQTDAALNFDGHVIIGWVTEDTTLITNTTGVPIIADGGGFGFYINGDDGDPTAVNMIPFSDPAAITAAPTLTSGVIVPDLVVDLTAANEFFWYTLGAKMRVVDADASTGVTDFYVNGRLVQSIVDSTCMDSTQTYGMTYAVQNGPIDTIDVAVDYTAVGITRPGLTYPYDTTADVASF